MCRSRRTSQLDFRRRWECLQDHQYQFESISLGLSIDFSTVVGLRQDTAENIAGPDEFPNTVDRFVVENLDHPYRWISLQKPMCNDVASVSIVDPTWSYNVHITFAPNASDDGEYLGLVIVKPHVFLCRSLQETASASQACPMCRMEEDGHSDFTLIELPDVDHMRQMIIRSIISLPDSFEASKSEEEKK